MRFAHLTLNNEYSLTSVPKPVALHIIVDPVINNQCFTSNKLSYQHTKHNSRRIIPNDQTQLFALAGS